MDTITTTYSNALLNGLTMIEFLVYMTFGIFGVMVNVLSDIVRRNVGSAKSPVKFSRAWWVKDNKIRMMISLILLPIAIICYGEFFSMDMTNAAAFFLGFSCDHLLEILKRKNMITNAYKNTNI